MRRRAGSPCSVMSAPSSSSGTIESDGKGMEISETGDWRMTMISSSSFTSSTTSTLRSGEGTTGFVQSMDEDRLLDTDLARAAWDASHKDQRLRRERSSTRSSCSRSSEVVRLSF